MVKNIVKLWTHGWAEMETVDLDIDKNIFLPNRCARHEKKTAAKQNREKKNCGQKIKWILN